MAETKQEQAGSSPMSLSEIAELSLPPSPASLSGSGRTTSSSAVRRLKAEAHLAMAKKMLKLEEEEADRRLERQRNILRLELEARHAAIDAASSDRSSRKDTSSSSLSSLLGVKPIPDWSDPETVGTNRTKQWVESQQQVRRSSASGRVLNSGKPGDLSLSVNARPADSSPLNGEIRQLKVQMEELSKHQEVLRAANTQTCVPTNYTEKMLIRQTVGRELPTFSGTPEEWPVFFATYTRTTVECGFSDSENIIRLQRSLKGAAKTAVGALLTLPQNLREVLGVLESRFGRPEAVVGALLAKARAGAQLKAGDFDGLIVFATAVKTVVSTMEHMRTEGHMFNPQLRQELVSRLPSALRLQWGEALVQSGQREVSLRAFSNWLSGRAEAAECVANLPEKPRSHTLRSESVLNTSISTLNGQDQAASKVKCLYCNGCHFVTTCSKFAASTTKKRQAWVKEKRRCYVCLVGEHLARNCPKQNLCGVDGCQYRHHPLLHRQHPVQDSVNSHAEESPEQTHHHDICNTTREKHDKVMLRILPVVVKGPIGEVQTWALLDEGSTVTLADAELIESLGVSGPREPLSLQWTNAIAQHDPDSQRVQFSIRGATCDESFMLTNVRTRRNLALASRSVDLRKYASRWTHLNPVTLPASSGRPLLLIGQDNSHLTVAREIVEGPANAPMATRTKLGWVVHGNVPSHMHSRVDAEVTLYTTAQDNNDTLHQLVCDSFSTENFGVTLKGPELKSEAVIRAEALLESTTRRVGERFETGLLWKSDEINLPASREMAFKRLCHMERKMDRDPDLSQQYCQKIEEYLEKGYARKLSPAEAEVEDNRTWYLPHFGVTNINKPGKLRFVFDAAAKVGGTSLNSSLLPGPDLLNPLVAVLMRFRQHRIAFGADVKEMFHQVRIRDVDQTAQRFLWRGTRRQGDPDVYAMEAMIFGAVCSPASAQFTMRLNAKEQAVQYPDVAVAINENFYMDDYFDSVDTEEEAVKMIADTVDVQKRGGFLLRNWMSNSREVLKAVPEDLRAADHLDIRPETDLPVERALGLRWDSNSDCFGFSVHPTRAAQLEQHPTKRAMLSIIMSVFDPLGFLAAFTVTSRILLQDVWVSGIGWDDDIPSETLARWRKWCEQLLEINQFALRRSYSTCKPEPSSTALHVFCDASGKAFATVAYLRVESSSGVECTLVAAKVRVAPLKPMSIPRLELQAAVLGTRLAQMLVKEHRIQWQKTVFWSDSKTVLQWIRSDARQFKPFVAHRVGEICESTSAKDWRWVPTRQNVADDATRGISVSELCDGRWRTGPEFLVQSEEEWPVEEVQAASEPDDTTELKAEFLGNTTECQPSPVYHESLPAVKNFTALTRLVRATAWVMRFIKNCSVKRTGDEPYHGMQITVEEYQAAESWWWKSVQQDDFPGDVKDLSATRPVSSKSRLNQLSPVMDDSGVIRLQGRIGRAVGVADAAKQPVILDPHHPFTQLLIQHYHEVAGHQGQEMVLNEIRQRFWIIRGRNAVRRAWKVCQLCSNNRSQPRVPPMAELPVNRLTPNVRPFSNCGLDYFGPITVKIGRRREKRYGALFTCLVTRAIHLEIAASLTTDSCVMAIRRFIGRRGYPRNIHSDNGTNLRGADRVLRESLQEFDQDTIQAKLVPKKINWHFNPPAAPHMGGAWERLVRSVKTALKAVLHEQVPTEETLQTLLAEAEALVNSRPLTHVSVDPDDLEALTPFHFLIGSSSPVHPPGVFSDGDACLRKSWRTAQALTDQFWKRWVREYLPELLRRTRWHGGSQANDLCVGDVVMLADSKLPRGCWPRGRVTAVFPGKDGRVRVVEVKTSSGSYRRPVSNLCKLDVHE